MADTLTFQTMVNRIADECGMRTDLLPQIQSAINSAIQQQDNEKFFFLEHEDNWTTTPGQNYYTPESVLSYAVGDSIAWQKITLLGGYQYKLQKWDMIKMDAVDVNAGWKSQPQAWAYYNDQIRLYATPLLAYVMTTWYWAKWPTLVNPGDINPWLNEGEVMIRSYAKADLYSNVLLAEENAEQLANRYLEIGKSAKKSLQKETTTKAMSGRVRPTRF